MRRVPIAVDRTRAPDALARMYAEMVRGKGDALRYVTPYLSSTSAGIFLICRAHCVAEQDHSEYFVEIHTGGEPKIIHALTIPTLFESLRHEDCWRRRSGQEAVVFQDAQQGFEFRDDRGIQLYVTDPISSAEQTTLRTNFTLRR